MSDVSIKTASKDPEPMENNAAAADIEKGREAHLANRTVSSYSWSNVTVTVKNRQTKSPKQILSNASGLVNAGELLALMGPRYNLSPLHPGSLHRADRYLAGLERQLS